MPEAAPAHRRPALIPGQIQKESENVASLPPDRSALRRGTETHLGTSRPEPLMEKPFRYTTPNRGMLQTMSGPDAKSNRGAVTQLLAEMRNGDGDAINRLFPLVYTELRRVA